MRDSLPDCFSEAEQSAFAFLMDCGCTGFAVDLLTHKVTYIDGEEDKQTWNIVELRCKYEAGEWDGNIEPDGET